MVLQLDWIQCCRATVDMWYFFNSHFLDIGTISPALCFWIGILLRTFQTIVWDKHLLYEWNCLERTSVLSFIDSTYCQWALFEHVEKCGIYFWKLTIFCPFQFCFLQSCEQYYVQTWSLFPLTTPIKQPLAFRTGSALQDGANALVTLQHHSLPHPIKASLQFCVSFHLSDTNFQSCRHWLLCCQPGFACCFHPIITSAPEWQALSDRLLWQHSDSVPVRLPQAHSWPLSHSTQRCKGTGFWWDWKSGYTLYMTYPICYLSAKVYWNGDLPPSHPPALCTNVKT